MRPGLKVFAAVLLATAAACAGAQNYPSKPIRMVVPFAPGGTGEFLSRSITPRMGELLGQQFIVDFRGGAGTTLAAGLVANAPADGYTILFTTPSTHVIALFMTRDLPYDPVKDFAPISLLAHAPNILVVHPSLPVKSMKELIALAKAKPNALSYGSAGIGSKYQGQVGPTPSAYWRNFRS